MQEAWGASEHLEGGRQTRCLVQRCLENWADLRGDAGCATEEGPTSGPAGGG